MTATIENLTVTVKLASDNDYLEVVRWCEENAETYRCPLDPKDAIPYFAIRSAHNRAIRYYVPLHKDECDLAFTFTNELDACHFKLRWSQYL